MKIEIETAKNGEKTAKCGSLYLHSKYNPSLEARRIVENIRLPYSPKNIILIEPGLSYNLIFLKEKFPEANFFAIRLAKDFSFLDSSFSFNFYYSPKDKNFSTALFNFFSEEKLLTAYFLQWENSARIFEEETRSLWNEIKTSLEKAKTILITRQFFEKKWLVNSINFIKYSRNFLNLEKKIQKDIVIIASGPSLKSIINIIKENQDNFFVIALSSAISACLYYGIKIDLCLSTDGGYWAGEHLKRLLNKNVSIALSSESYCKGSYLRHFNILPLKYSDGLSKKILEDQGIKSLTAERNPTVSGTACLMAEKLTEKSIYFLGLDLAPCKGFQHTMPNELELNNSTQDNRIKTKMTRLTKSQINSASLDIYLDWFKNTSFANKKIFRVIEENERKNSLGDIQDISKKEFLENIKKIKNKESIMQSSNENLFSTKVVQPLSSAYFEKSFEKETLRGKQTKNDFCQITKLLQSEVFEKQIFPLDYVSLERNPDSNEIKEKIQNEKNELLNKIRKILNG